MGLSEREQTNRRMLRARDQMDRRYADPLDVATLAALTHLSRSHFGRTLKKVYGETPHQFLRRRRVERAMTLLRQTERPVTEIAWEVGFASLGTFSRTFRSVVGCSPSRFRARHGTLAVPTCFIAAWTRPRDRRAAGVEITQEPVEQPYGTDVGCRDPFGNHVRISELSGASPAEVQRAYETEG